MGGGWHGMCSKGVGFGCKIDRGRHVASRSCQEPSAKYMETWDVEVHLVIARVCLPCPHSHTRPTPTTCCVTKRRALQRKVLRPPHNTNHSASAKYPAPPHLAPTPPPPRACCRHYSHAPHSPRFRLSTRRGPGAAGSCAALHAALPVGDDGT